MAAWAVVWAWARTGRVMVCRVGWSTTMAGPEVVGTATAAVLVSAWIAACAAPFGTVFPVGAGSGVGEPGAGGGAAQHAAPPGAPSGRHGQGQLVGGLPADPGGFLTDCCAALSLRT